MKLNTAFHLNHEGGFCIWVHSQTQKKIKWWAQVWTDLFIKGVHLILSGRDATHKAYHTRQVLQVIPSKQPVIQILSISKPFWTIQAVRQCSIREQAYILMIYIQHTTTLTGFKIKLSDIAINLQISKLRFTKTCQPNTTTATATDRQMHSFN